MSVAQTELQGCCGKDLPPGTGLATVSCAAHHGALILLSGSWQCPKTAFERLSLLRLQKNSQVWLFPCTAKGESLADWEKYIVENNHVHPVLVRLESAGTGNGNESIPPWISLCWRAECGSWRDLSCCCQSVFLIQERLSPQALYVLDKNDIVIGMKRTCFLSQCAWKEPKGISKWHCNANTLEVSTFVCSLVLCIRWTDASETTLVLYLS